MPLKISILIFWLPPLSTILIYSLTSNYIKLYHTATLKWYILASTCIVLLMLMFQLWLEQRLVAAFAKFRFRVSIFAICIPHICPFLYTTTLFRGKGKGVYYSKTGSPCRQPIAVSDISINICLIDIISIYHKQIQRTTEWEASRLVYPHVTLKKQQMGWGTRPATVGKLVMS